MNKYTSFEDFYSKNKNQFEEVRYSHSRLKSIAELAQTGSAIAESERLTFDFLNLSNLVTDLLFGLSNSVLESKSKLKEVEGIFFRDSPTKSAADKAKLVQADPQYITANTNYNNLNDLFEYLQLKKKDFESAYYYYREISAKK